MDDPGNSPIVAERFLELLSALGIEYLFANAGTDFAPVIEGFARCEQRGARTPVPVTVPHENVAVGLAMGAYLASGKPQAIMVHVNVGTANALCGLMNAFRGNVPILVFAGRTPYTESGAVRGARSGENHWAQEMFDQGGIVRETVKWSHELFDPDLVDTALTRALAIAESDPKGPVYMTLPREVLAAPCAPQPGAPRPMRPTRCAPDPEGLQRAADIIRGAENPVIVTTNGGRTPQEFEALGIFADTFAIPVTQRKPRFMALSTDHPMHRGYDPDELLSAADAVLAIECDVPWLPSKSAPDLACKVIQIGADPLFTSYPMRGFRADETLVGAVPDVLFGLRNSLEPYRLTESDRITERRKRVTSEHLHQRKAWSAALKQSKDRHPIDPIWASHCINAIKGEDGIIVRELPLVMGQMNFTRPGCYISPNWAAGLGSGLGTALGVKLFHPARLVICVLGDGSYMFGTPLAAHYLAGAESLPVLTVIFNNERWDAVRKSTRGMYPDGAAAKAEREAFTHFEKDTRYEKVVEAVGGLGLRVTDPSALPEALRRAADAVLLDRRQAVVNVVCA